MSLPPDPHDDDLAEPSAPPPPPPAPPPPAPTAGSNAGPAAAAAEPADDVRPAPPSPAYPQPTEAMLATATMPVPPADGPTAADGRIGAGAGDAVATTGPSSSGSGGKGRLGLMLAGVVAVIVLAGGVVLATGGDDTSDTASPPADESPTEGEPPAGGAADDGTENDDTASGTADDGTVGDDLPGTADAPAGAAPAPSAGDESPVEVAEAFFDAVDSGDCAGVVGRMTPESLDNLDQTPDAAIADCEADNDGAAAAAAAEWGDVRLVSENGDRATVAVTVRVGAEETERDLPLRRVDGEWMMHLDTSLTAPAG
jgi:hypothetical protein